MLTVPDPIFEVGTRLGRVVPRPAASDSGAVSEMEHCRGGGALVMDPYIIYEHRRRSLGVRLSAGPKFCGAYGTAIIAGQQGWEKANPGEHFAGFVLHSTSEILIYLTFFFFSFPDK